MLQERGDISPALLHFVFNGAGCTALRVLLRFLSSLSVVRFGA
jgi:hypothetical protein